VCKPKHFQEIALLWSVVNILVGQMDLTAYVANCVYIIGGQICVCLILRVYEMATATEQKQNKYLDLFSLSFSFELNGVLVWFVFIIVKINSSKQPLPWDCITSSSTIWLVLNCSLCHITFLQ